MKFRELKLRRDPACPICGDHPTIKELIDYDQFSGIQPAPAENLYSRPPSPLPSPSGEGITIVRFPFARQRSCDLRRTILQETGE